jgi:hypothetical protein
VLDDARPIFDLYLSRDGKLMTVTVTDEGFTVLYHK